MFETEGYLLRSLFVCLRPGPSPYLAQTEDGIHIVIVRRSVAVAGGAGGAAEWESEREERLTAGITASALHLVPAGEPVLEPVSARARQLGYLTVDDLKRAVLMQGATWWQGSAYHCPLCDVNFGDRQRAAAHVVKLQHPVLRMD